MGMFGSKIPKDALVFVKDAQAVFTVWYFHLMLGQRPDVAVIAEELLHLDRCLATLQDTYPGLDASGLMPWAKNVADASPSRPACSAQYARWAEIFCGGLFPSP